LNISLVIWAKLTQGNGMGTCRWSTYILCFNL